MSKIALNRNLYCILGILLLAGTLFSYSEEPAPELRPSLWSSPDINKKSDFPGPENQKNSNMTYPAIATLVNSSASGSVLLSFIRVSQDDEEFFFQRKTADGKWQTIQPAQISLVKIGNLTLGKSEDQGLINGTYAYRVLAKKQSGRIIASDESIVGLEYSSAVLHPRAIDLNQDGIVDEEDLLDLMQNHFSETETSKTEDLWNLGSAWYTGQSVIRH